MALLFTFRRNGGLNESVGEELLDFSRPLLTTRSLAVGFVFQERSQ